MYTNKNTTVKEFRSKLFNSNIDTVQFFSVNKSSYTSSLLFKEKLKLPIKMDKQMAMMKESIGITDQILKNISEKRFDIMMEGTESRDVVLAAMTKMASINVRYGMNAGFLYKAQSLVRANQIDSDLNLLSKTVKGVKTIKDFVKTIMSRDMPSIEAIEKHPMAGIYNKVIVISRDFENKVNQGIVNATRSDSIKKFRKVGFMNSEVYPMMTKRDAYRVYRTDPAVRRSRDKYKAMTISRYFKMTKVFSEEAIVQYLLKNNSLSAQSLYSIFENIAGLMMRENMLIPSEFVSGVNGFENMLNLLRHRTTTGYTYELNKPEILEMANISTVMDIMEITGFIGTVARDAKDAIDLYKSSTTTRQRRVFQLSSENASLAEKYVCFMNRLCSKPTIDMGNLMNRQSAVCFYASNQMRGQGVYEEFTTIRVWALRTATLVMFTSPIMMEFCLLETSLVTGLSVVRQDDLEHISKIVMLERRSKARRPGPTSWRPTSAGTRWTWATSPSPRSRPSTSRAPTPAPRSWP